MDVVVWRQFENQMHSIRIAMPWQMLFVFSVWVEAHLKLRLGLVKSNRGYGVYFCSAPQMD